MREEGRYPDGDESHPGPPPPHIVFQHPVKLLQELATPAAEEAYRLHVMVSVDWCHA